MRSGRPILSGAKRRQKKAARPGEEKPRTHLGGKDAAALTSAFWYLGSPTRVSTKTTVLPATGLFRRWKPGFGTRAGVHFARVAKPAFVRRTKGPRTPIKRSA